MTGDSGLRGLRLGEFIEKLPRPRDPACVRDGVKSLAFVENAAPP